VLRAALGLLERPDGPVILEDFPEDPPGLTDTPGWIAPRTQAATFTTPADWQTAFQAELRTLMPIWSDVRKKRTTTGLSFLPPEAWPALAADVLAGGLPITPQLGTTALTVRFLCDDIKALYGEAAQAHAPKPSPRQVDTWFWRHTIAGEMLRALRTIAMASDNNGLKTVGGRFFVPAPWVV
jgi:hypothetical protein